MEIKLRNKFIIWLACTILYLTAAVVGMVYSFVYVDALGLFTSLIIGVTMALLAALVIFTTLAYTNWRNA